MAQPDELLHSDESMPASEPAVASREIAERGLAGVAMGLVIGAVLGAVIGAVLFGFPGGDQSSRDATMFWVCTVVGAVAASVAGFVFGGGRGVRDARRQAEAEARGGR